MTVRVSRRSVLAGLAAAPLIARAAEPARHEPFSFLFITDTHIEPELNAAGGCRAAFARARAVGGDFAIQGGDHVFDALGATRGRATDLLSLYQRTEQDLGMAVHHAIGNHDCFGIYKQSGATPDDPLYGKKFFTDAFGALHTSFDHRGVHFVVLDSIRITQAHQYEGGIDAGQLAWLRRDLDALPSGMPIVIITHIPLLTDYANRLPPLPDPAAQQALEGRLSVVNAADVLALLAGRNVLGVLQGHNHVNETVTWNGIAFQTCGAVCGAWWHGPHDGTPEGFTTVRIADNRMTTEYQTYGFHSVAPR